VNARAAHTYGFRARFQLPTGTALDEDADRLQIHLPGIPAPLTLKAIGATTIRDSSALSIAGTGFLSDADAREAGARVKQALTFAAVELRMGIDVGKDKFLSGFGEIVKDQARKQGVRLLDDVHGLVVYPEDLEVRFSYSRARLTAVRNKGRFVEVFTRAFAQTKPLDSKTALSVELFVSSFFEASPRAQLLAMLSAVEALAEQELQGGKILAVVNESIVRAKMLPEGPSKQTLLSRLGELRRESISASCRRLISSLLSPQDAERFTEIYGARSKLLHEGSLPKGADLAAMVRDLEDITARFLGSQLGISSHGGRNGARS
jgi:hypothetical protein